MGKSFASANGVSPFISDIQAPAALGMTARAFREAVIRQGVKHTKLGMRIIVHVDDLRGLSRDGERTPDDVLASCGFKRAG